MKPKDSVHREWWICGLAALAGLAQCRQADRPMVVREMNVFPSATPRSDLVKTSREFKS